MNLSFEQNDMLGQIKQNVKDGSLNMKCLLIAVPFCVLLAGCAVDKYQAAAPHFSGQSAVHHDAKIIVMLEPIFPGKPFSETVCDNAIGVSWSPEESQHIGFTQHYASTLLNNGPQFAMLAALPANQRIGMSASGDMKPLNIDSRILVPFGRFISDNLRDAVGTDGQVCEDLKCVEQAEHEWPKARLVSVQFTKFRVAEQQRNMLFLEVEGTASVKNADAMTSTISIHHSLNRSITSEGMWHSDFLKAMNIIANESSSAVVTQIRDAAL